MDDKIFMKRALELARKGMGRTSPNPMVGSVLVKNGRIIGEGFHRQYGEKHAEVAAIESAGTSVEGATLYCNLEPCTDTIPAKKTPACTGRIIQEKIGRVVLATQDPNPYVNGRGIAQLQESGIEVTVGVEEAEAAVLNERYFKYIRTGLPFVHLKIAQSLDGRIATSNGNSQWITNRNAIKKVHELRGTYDAVLVGANTVLKDNPSLTVRLSPGRNPYRILLDDQLIIPENSNLISDEIRHKTIIFTTRSADYPRVKELLKREIQVIPVPPDSRGFVSLSDVLERLAELKIASVLVEGGGQVFTSFIREHLFDKISVFIAPLIIGSGIQSINDLGTKSLDESIRLEHTKIESVDGQVILEGYRKKAAPVEKAVENF